MSHLKEMPGFYCVWEDEGFSFWFVDMGDTLTFHIKHDGTINKERYKRIQYCLDCLIVNLMEKGMKRLETWIKNDDKESIKFAEVFGFHPTGYEIVVNDTRDGKEHELTELYLIFPEV